MVAKTKDDVQKKIKYVVESYDILEWKRPVVRNACTSQVTLAELTFEFMSYARSCYTV